jgi:hypothetical protein
MKVSPIASSNGILTAGYAHELSFRRLELVFGRCTGTPLIAHGGGSREGDRGGSQKALLVLLGVFLGRGIQETRRYFWCVERLSTAVVRMEPGLKLKASSFEGSEHPHER